MKASQALDAGSIPATRSMFIEQIQVDLIAQGVQILSFICHYFFDGMHDLELLYTYHKSFILKFKKFAARRTPWFTFAVQTLQTLFKF